MPFAFEKLHVYQKALDFADAVCRLTKAFPRGYFFLANQLNRAALSIAANIAEGNGRFTKAERKKQIVERRNGETAHDLLPAAVSSLLSTLCFWWEMPNRSPPAHEHVPGLSILLPVQGAASRVRAARRLWPGHESVRPERPAESICLGGEREV